jgi:hypothetical protein
LAGAAAGAENRPGSPAVLEGIISVSDLSKKQIVRWIGPDGKRCTPGTAGATKRVEESRKWYGTVKGKPKALSRDKATALKMLRRLLAKADEASVGLVDPHADRKARPVAEHLKDFAAALRAKGNDSRHVKQTVAHCQALLDGCRFVMPGDLDLSAAQAWLTSLRAGAPAIGKPDRAELPARGDRPALPAG